MGGPDRYTYNYKELAAMFVKNEGLHEGFWKIYAEFGIKAVNAGPSDDEIYPTAMIPLLKIGIQKSDNKNEDPITVDASKVNPRPTANNPK